jgi:hypothetical protein
MKKSLLFLLMLVTGVVYAQVQVNLQQPPPNQLRATDIWNVTLINPSARSIPVIISGTLEDSREGIVVTGVSKMVTLPPGRKTITYDDVKSGNVTFKSGKWREAFTRTGNAPSGNYTICITVKNETGEEIGNDCINQPVEIISALNLISPADGDIIESGQLPLFSWLTAMPTPVGSFTYKIKIVEIKGNQSPEEALKKNQVWFEKFDLKTATFIYPIAAKKLEKNKKYCWQIDVIQNNQSIASSETWKFELSDTGSSGGLKSLTINPSGGGGGGGVSGGNTNTIQSNPQPPVSSCSAAPSSVTITNQTPSPKSAADFVQQNIKVGEFTMKVLSASGNSSALTGTGSIVVAWLKTPIAVEFKNIKVNSVDEFYQGEIISQFDSSPDTWPQQWLINGAGSFNWTTNLVKKLNKWMHNTLSGYPAANKLVKDFDLNQMVQDNTNTPLKLPLGVNDAEGYTIAISEMKFEPTVAKLNCVAVFPVNEYNDSIGFKGSNILFSSGGPSAQSAKLGLIDDVTFIGNVPNGDSYHLVFKKEAGATDGTFISWDCAGFRELNIDLDILFPRTWLKPIPDNGTDKAKCNIVTNIVNWDDWIIEANLPKSSITGATGMDLEVMSLYYDHSNVRNPDSLVFPQNYPIGATTGVDFTGFFIKKAKVTLPDNFKTSSQNITVQINNMIINRQGLTGNVTAHNIVNFPNGNISGLGASVDTLKLEIICSSLTNAYLRGKIVLPVSEVIAANALLYKVMFSSGNNFQFSITPQGPVTAKFFSDAKLILANTSSINLTLNSSTKFDINLNGEFEWANINIGPVKNVKMKMDFQNVGLNYDNSTGTNNFVFNKGTWSFASPQKFLSNFPVSIKNVKFGMKPKQGIEVLRGALSFSVVVNLDDKIGGSSALSVLGSIEKDTAGKFHPKFVAVEVDTIKIYANLSAVKLDGKIVFFNGSPVDGNGFKGTIKATINSIKSEINSTLIMGSTNHNNGANFYRYWYVDAKIVLPKSAAIPFMSGLAFYGFGAGVWKRMDVSNIPKPDPATIQNATQTSGSAVSGATFIPNPGVGLGLKVLAVIGTYPDPNAFNGDASLSGQFSPSGGLNKIEFNFDFWSMAELTARANAEILGNANIQYVPPTKLFLLSASVLINKPGLITTVGVNNINDRVNLSLSIDGKNNKWYFICGTPHQTNKVKVLSVNAWEYVLIGNHLSPFLTPPKGFQNSTITGLNSVGISLSPFPVSIPSQASTGKGFAFGVGVNFENEKSFKLSPVTVKYGAGGGFEVNLSLLQYPGGSVCGNYSPIGFRNWYSTGMVAAWFKGYLLAEWPKLVGTGKNTFTFADIKTGIGVMAGFPNPVWVVGTAVCTVKIAGLINWSGSVDLNYNTPCTPQYIPPANSTVPEEDATQEIGDMIVNIDTPQIPDRIDPAKKIGVMLGYTPNGVFDVQEIQSDGSIINRVFQVRYFPTLTRLGFSPLQTQSSSISGNATLAQNLGGLSVLNNVNQTNQSQQTSVPQINLIRSGGPNSIGQYEYHIQRPFSFPFRNLDDTTKYRLVLRAELWTLNPVSNSWEQAKTKIGNNLITETKTVIFNSGIMLPPSPVTASIQNYQLRANKFNQTISVVK